MRRVPNPEQVLRVVRPEGEPAPVVLDSPHSGSLYPDRTLLASLVLRRALDEAFERFGCVFHANCHSTPSIWGEGYPKAGQRYEQHYTLGDRDGTTADRRFTPFVRDVSTSCEFQWKWNGWWCR